jgi:hypothetical protein
MFCLLRPKDQANTGPFAQFQNCFDDEEELTKLIMELLGRVPNVEPERETVQAQVKIFRNEIASIEAKLSDKKEQNDNVLRVEQVSYAELFEEVKFLYQDINSLGSKLSSEIASRVTERVLEEVSPLVRGHFLPQQVLDELKWILNMDIYRTEYEVNIKLTEHPENKDYLSSVLSHMKNTIKLEVAEDF